MVHKIPDAADTQRTKELLLLEQKLGKERMNKLQEMFHLIDADNSKEIERDEVIQFNLYLDPVSGIERIESDATLLFRLADTDGNGAIDEIEWLSGWAKSIECNNGSTEFVDAFVNNFNLIISTRCIKQEHIETVMQFGFNTLSKILKWIRKAKANVKAENMKK